MSAAPALAGRAWLAFGDGKYAGRFGSRGAAQRWLDRYARRGLAAVRNDATEEAWERRFGSWFVLAQAGGAPAAPPRDITEGGSTHD